MHAIRRLHRIGAGALGIASFVLASAQSFNPPAPDWVKPGVQLTYYAAYASVGFGKTLVPDDNAQPDENGMVWTDENGQKYRPQEAGRSSGQAYNQVTIAHLGAQEAVLAIENHGIDVATNVIAAPQTLGEIVAPLEAGEYWMHPQILRSMLSGREPGVKARRFPFQLGGKGYDALALTRTRATGQSVQVFDLASGVLLSSSMVTNKPDSTWAPGAGGQAEPGGGGKILAQLKLIGIRELQLPWMQAPDVGAGPQVRSLVYQGAHSVSMMGSPPMVLPQRASLTARASGRGWALFDEVVERMTVYRTPDVPTASTRAMGAGQLGGLWLPPLGLAALRPGQVLDTDPITRVQHAVNATDGTRVQIMATGMQNRTLYTYDVRSGLLVRMQAQQQVAQTLMDVTLELVSQN